MDQRTNNMSKQQKKTEEVENLNNTALGVFQHPETKEWCLAYIKYDAVTGNVKFEKAISYGTSELEAKDRFKIEAANSGII